MINRLFAWEASKVQKPNILLQGWKREQAHGLDSHTVNYPSTCVFGDGWSTEMFGDLKSVWHLDWWFYTHWRVIPGPEKPPCQPTVVVFLLVFAPFKIKLLLNRPRVQWVLSKFRKSFEQHPKTLPVYLINRPGWMGCLHLCSHCCCAAKFSSLENISPKSSDTLGLKTNNAQNLTLARAFVHIVSWFLYLRLVFVCLTMCRSTCRAQKCNTCARMHMCLWSEGGRGQTLRGSVALGHSGSKGSLQREGRQEPSPPHEP